MAQRVVQQTTKAIPTMMQSNLTQNVSKLIFGVGNHHWTKSRESVGLRLVNVFAERLGWRWSRLPSAQADIAQKSGVMLVRPLTYMRIENARSMKLLRSMITVEPKNVILVYPDIELPVGQVQFAVTNPRKSEFLEEFVPELLVESSEQLVIGIGKPQIRAEFIPPVSLNSDDALLEEQFFSNRMNEADERSLSMAFERGIEILKRETNLYN